MDHNLAQRRRGLEDKIPDIKNEPNHHYEKGSSSREGLAAAVAAFQKKLPLEVPVVVSGKEIVYFARAIVTKTFEPMAPYLITAAMYLVLALIFSWLQGKLERRLRQSGRR